MNKGLPYGSLLDIFEARSSFIYYRIKEGIIIVRGQVEVLKFVKGEQEMKRAAVLSDGDHFGEISLTIQRDQFQTMLDKASPRLREMLEDECHRRLVY